MMVCYPNVSIDSHRKALRLVMAPRQSATFTCFIVIIFVNFLTCHKTPIRPTTPAPSDSLEDQLDANQTQQEATLEDDTTTTTSRTTNSNAGAGTSASTSAPVTLATPAIASTPQALELSVPNATSQSRAGNENGTAAKDEAPDPQGYKESMGIKALEDRLGQLPTPAPPSNLPLITTLASSTNDDDPQSQDDLHKLYLDNHAPPVRDFDGATTVASNHNGSFSIEGAKLQTDVMTSAQNLEALESRIQRTSNSNHLEEAAAVGRLSQDEALRWSGHFDQSDSSSGLPPNVGRPSGHDQGTGQPLLQTLPSFPTGSLIPNASLFDLLHIIKHLNLMSGDEKTMYHNVQHRPREPEQVLRAESLMNSAQTGSRMFGTNGSPGPPHPLSPAPNVAVALPEVLATLESATQNQLDGQRQQQSSELMNQANGSPVSELVVDKAASVRTSSSTGKRGAKLTGSLDTTRRPPKYSLISPYSANFDLGSELLIKNATSNHASVSTDKSHQTDKAVSPGPLDETGNKHGLAIGSKPAPEKSPASRGTAELSQVVYYAINDKGATRRKTTKNHQQQASQETRGKSKPAIKSEFVKNSTIYDSNSKRGERDIVDHSQRSLSGRNQTLSTPLNHKPDDKAELTPINIKYSDGTTPNGDQRHQQVQIMDHPMPRKLKKNEPPYQMMDKPAISLAHSRPVLHHATKDEGFNQTSYGATSEQQATPNYLDDPHKKSYYWTSEQGSLYLDDLSLNPRPLTIGELARQHGIAPLEKQHLPKPSSFMGTIPRPAYPLVEDFGLSSESGLEENYTNLHHDHQAELTLTGSSTESKRHATQPPFKIDEELKRKIAVKAIEAATRDPELSATLFGSLLNLNSETDARRPRPSWTAPSTTVDYHHGLDQPYAILRNHHLQGDQQPPIADDLWPNSYQLLRPHQLAAPAVAASTNYKFNNLGTALPRPAGLQQVVAKSTTAQPVNLMIADLNDKWALSRMPDLVPIPLAATVPGYLIRLPNGEILAAALTNMFSIQGIQRGPLTTNYKNLLNNKLKGLMKQLNGSPSGKLSSNHFGSVVADSGQQPTVVLPTSHYAPISLPPTGTKSGQKVKHHHQSRDKGAVGAVGLFSRSVLSQLGLRSSKTNQHDFNRPSKYSNGKIKTGTSDGSRQNKPRIVKLTNSPFPVPDFTHQELANLPIADPSEPVFSFLDASQLKDPPSYPPKLARLNQPQSMVVAPSELDHQVVHSPSGRPDLEASGSGPLSLNLRDDLNHLLDNSRGLAHLGTFSGISADDYFNYSSKKRKSKATFPSSRLEPLLKWLASKRAKVLRKALKSCAGKI